MHPFSSVSLNTYYQNYKVCKGFASRYFAGIFNSRPIGSYNLYHQFEFSKPLCRLDIEHKTFPFWILKCDIWCLSEIKQKRVLHCFLKCHAAFNF